MDKLCKFCREQTPALSCRYHMSATLQKSAKDQSPMGTTLCKEGSITVPLCVLGAALVMVAIPCIFACWMGMKHKKRKMSDPCSCGC